MLKDFYTVTQRQAHEGGFTATVALNASHAIYGAHFPGNPVTPGVCMLQIGKELIEAHYGIRLRMTGARNVKFLQAVNPLLHPNIVFTVNCAIHGGTVVADTAVGWDNEVFVKISTGYNIYE